MKRALHALTKKGYSILPAVATTHRQSDNVTARPNTCNPSYDFAIDSDRSGSWDQLLGTRFLPYIAKVRASGYLETCWNESGEKFDYGNAEQLLENGAQILVLQARYSQPNEKQRSFFLTTKYSSSVVRAISMVFGRVEKSEGTTFSDRYYPYQVVNPFEVVLSAQSWGHSVYESGLDVFCGLNGQGCGYGQSNEIKDKVVFQGEVEKFIDSVPHCQ